MQPFNAIDAVSPAFARTKLVLFTPFRWGRTWKLCATGYLAFAGTFFFPFPLIGLFFLPLARRSGGGAAVAAVSAVVLVAMAVFLVFFYLFARLQFAFFDIVLNRGEFVAPAWRKYGPQTWQWVGFSVALGTLMMVVMAAPCVTYGRHLFALFESIKSMGQPPPVGLIIGFYAGYFLFYGLFLLMMLVCTTLADFIVPSLALEQVSLAEAFSRFGRFIQRETGQFLGFVAMHTLLGIAGYFIQIICFEIVFLLQLLVVGLVAFLIGLALHLAGVPMPFLIVLAVILGVALYLFNMVYVMLGSFGILLTFMQAYTLYFLGGRYSLLGDLLEKSTPPQPPPAAYYMPPPAAPPQPL